MRIQDLLNIEEFGSIIGRKKEVNALSELLRMDKNWRLVHVYGPGGIGKTTLITLLAQDLGQDRCLLFDGHSGFRQPKDWLRALAKLLQQTELGHVTADYPLNPPNDAWTDSDIKALAERLNRAASNAGGIVLLLDTFEQWSPIEDWLRNVWLPLLEPHVRVCTAGRNPLEGPWERGGWRRLVQNVELKPFSTADFDAYIHSFGITDPLVREKLLKFTGRIPLALSIAVEIINRKQKPEFLDSAEQHHTTSYLAQELLRDLGNTIYHRYIEVASVLWRFNQEWLQLILGEPVPDETFREFCRLPVVISFEGGWVLHDSIRNWTRSDFLRRKPQTLEAYRIKALTELQKREQSNAPANTFYALDKLFLHENDLVRHYCFSGEIDGIVFQNIREEDLDRIEELYEAYGRHKGVVTSGDPVFLPYIRTLWREEPTGFIGLWRLGKLVAFYSFLHLNEHTVPILQKYPIAASYLENSERTPREYAHLCVGIEPSLEEVVGGTFAQHMAHQYNKSDLVFNPSPYPEWYPVLQSVGFDPIPWGDAETNGGVSFKGFLLDLRLEDFAAKVDRLYAGKRSAVEEAKILAPLKPEKAHELVKNILQHYKNLNKQPDLIAAIGPYLEGFHQASHLTGQILVIRKQLEHALSLMEQSGSDDQLYASILRLAYLKKIGSHETVAERLKMPSATYYRHLKKAIARLSDLIVSENT